MRSPYVFSVVCKLPSWVLAAAAITAHAHDGQHGASKGLEPLSAIWDFTLPTLDGKRFVTVSELRGPVLVNFWGRDCPPCVAELPRLEAFAQANPVWTVLLVGVDAPTDAREFVQRHGVQLTVLRPGANVAALMRVAGNRSGGLPFTVTLRTDAQAVRICDRQAGGLAEPDLIRIAAACGEAGRP